MTAFSQLRHGLSFEADEGYTVNLFTNLPVCALLTPQNHIQFTIDLSLMDQETNRGGLWLYRKVYVHLHISNALWADADRFMLHRFQCSECMIYVQDYETNQHFALSSHKIFFFVQSLQLYKAIIWSSSALFSVAQVSDWFRSIAIHKF